jgi:hypothetical protein
MKIIEQPGANERMDYTVEFVEHRLEDVVARLNRFGRADEKPFEAAAKVSEFLQRAYDLFLSPVVQSMASRQVATLGQQFHPLRVQRWAWSSLNPWLTWLKPTAETIHGQRRSVPADHPLRQAERRGSDMLSASFDFYRDIRDAMSEANFFGVYGSIFSFYLVDKPRPSRSAAGETRDGKHATFVQEALAAIAEGGYPEAVARAGALLARRGQPLPLARLQLKKELLADYKDFLPDLPSDTARRIRGEQDLIVTYERDAAIGALPALLANLDDRRRFLTLLERLPADPRVQADGVTPEQAATLERIRQVLGPNEGGAALAERSAESPRELEGVRK